MNNNHQGSRYMKVVFKKKNFYFLLSLVLSVNLREKKCRKRGKLPEAGRLRSAAAELGLVLRAPWYTASPSGATRACSELLVMVSCQEKEWVG